MYNFDSISDEDFIIARDSVASSLANIYPEFDLGRGAAFDDLIISPQAKLRVLEDLRQQDFYKSFTLSELSSSDSDSLLDLILSRYFVSRNLGDFASGIIQLVFSSTSTVNIREGFIFTVGELQFSTTEAKRIFADEALAVSANDDFFRPLGDNTWYVNIPAVATASGEIYNIPGRTSMTPSISIGNLVSARALTTFTGGTSRESNAQLLSRLPTRYAAQTTGSAEGIRSIIYNNFPSLDVAIVGKGNPALLRDSRNPLGLPSGGFTDIYVRPSVQAPIREEVVEAEVISPSNSLLQLRLTSDIYPGVQQLISVSPLGVDAVLPVVDIVSYSTPPELPYESNIVSPVDSYGSHRHNLKIQFRDTVRNTASMSIGDTRQYRVEFLGSPIVGDIQRLLTSQDLINPGTNILVKGGIPAVTSFNIHVKRYVNDPLVDTDLIKSSIIDALADYGVGTNELDSSTIKTAVNRHIGSRSYVDTSKFSMVSSVYLPNNTVTTISNKDKIVVTNVLNLGVSRDTLAFYTNVDKIVIEVEDIRW